MPLSPCYFVHPWDKLYMYTYGYIGKNWSTPRIQLLNSNLRLFSWMLAADRRSCCLCSLGILLVPHQILVFFWFEPRHDKANKMSLRPAKTQINSDQSLRCALKGSLRTQAFFMRTAKTLIRYADLSLRWAHSHFVGFDMGWLISSSDPIWFAKFLEVESSNWSSSKCSLYIQYIQNNFGMIFLNLQIIMVHSNNQNISNLFSCNYYVFSVKPFRCLGVTIAIVWWKRSRQNKSEGKPSNM